MAVPYRRHIARFKIADVSEGQLKFFDCSGEDMIDIDEDGRAELDRHTWVVVGVDGQRASANAVRLFENGDIDRNLFLAGKLLQVVSCRRTSRSSSYTLSLA